MVVCSYIVVYLNVLKNVAMALYKAVLTRLATRTCKSLVNHKYLLCNMNNISVEI